MSRPMKIAPMKIAIEAQRIFRHHKHGMDFVALELIRELQKIDTYNEYRIYVALGSDICLHLTSNFKIIELSTPTYALWEQWALPRAVERWGADLLHVTSNTAPLKLSTPLITTLHDVIFMEPYKKENSMTTYQRLGRLYRRYVVPKVVQNSTKIITVSNYEKRQIIDTLHTPADKIDVIYNGYSSHFKPTELTVKIKTKYQLPDKYMFFLGNTDPKKNTPNTLKAYSIYIEHCRKHNIMPSHLVIADLPYNTIRSMVSDNIWQVIKKTVTPTGYINNKDLPSIYSSAQIFLYPSLRESFGIPLLEAMSCGVSIICSDTSAIPEIACDAAMYVNPNDPQEIAQAIINIKPDQFKKQAKECIAKYSWHQSATQLLSLYQSVYNQSKYNNTHLL